MTSNIGSDHILENKKDEVIKELKQVLKPEFINRIDEIIIFNELTKDVMYEILDKLIATTEQRLSDKQIKIEITPKAKDYLVELGYDKAFGARPLKRVISKEIEEPLAHLIIKGEIKPKQTITFDFINNQIEVK